MVATVDQLISKDTGKGWWSILLCVKEGYKNRKKMAHRTHISINTVSRRLDELVDEGYLEKDGSFNYHLTEQGEDLMGMISEAFHE